MTHIEDLERIRKQHRLARAWLLARDAHKQLDAHNAEKREKPDPDVEAYRLAKSDEEE